MVVLGDSTSFTDATGPQLPGHPTLYPNVASRHLGERMGRPVEVTVVARAGLTVRDAVRVVTKDRHVQFDLLPPADAVVIGVGSFDHAPLGVPPALEAVVPFVRPTALRRRVRTGLHRANPTLVRAMGGRRARTSPREADRLHALLLDQVRWLTQGRAARVVLGPTSHRSAYYANRHPGFVAAERRHLAAGSEHGFAPVAVWACVEPHLDQLNADGIHWPDTVHVAVGRRIADALVRQLSGDAPTIGLPGGS